MLRTRPIHFTSHIDEFRRLLGALGLHPTVTDDGWAEFDAGSGRFAVHAAAAGTAEDGVTALGFEVPDAAEFARRTREAGIEARVEEAGHGTTVRVDAGCGLTFFADPVPQPAAAPEETAVEAAADPNLAVCPLWYSPDVAAASAALRAIGARPRITSDNGTWADFSAKNGGLVAVHRAESTAVVPAFEYDGDLAIPAARLDAAHLSAVIVDETYGHSLRIDNPDGGAPIWVNRSQRDLYGYTRHD